jgi:hypothetical protein
MPENCEWSAESSAMRAGSFMSPERTFTMARPDLATRDEGGGGGGERKRRRVLVPCSQRTAQHNAAQQN